MSTRYFLHLSYNGYYFRGWQRQDGVNSVQETIETAIEHILKEKISIVGCGRTDAQVHATQFFAHFDTESKWEYDLAYRMNQLLPNHIVIHEILSMKESPHARFDAISRTYAYYIHTEKNPFLDKFSYFYQIENLNIEQMKMAVDLLTKYEDFISFCKTPEHNQTTICHVLNANIKFNEQNNQIKFEMTANRFLRGMIRAIVQYILDIGSGNFSVKDYEALLIEKPPANLKAIAAPYGLYLTKVNYPFLSTSSKVLPMPDNFN